MRIRVLLFVFLSSSVHLFAQWRTIGDIDTYHMRGGTELLLAAGACSVRVHILADDLVRVRYLRERALRPDLSWAVVKRDWPTVTTDITDSPGSLTVKTRTLDIVITKKPLRISFRDRAGDLICEDLPSKGMSWNGSQVRLWKRAPIDEYYYGLGEKTGSLQRRYRHMSMWNSDIPAYGPDTDPLYQSIPFFYAIRKGKAYGIFLDNTFWSSFDMGKESPDEYSFGATDGDLDYYFFYGPSPRTILSRFTELVGTMPLPPRWSLGYQQCRWSYTPEARVREIARGFRQRNIPCDVIYLDIDYMDGYRIFTWNPTAFPKPKSLIRDLAEDGFKVAVIVDPGIKTDTAYHAYRSGLAGSHFVTYPDGRVFVGKVWPGECAFPDFTRPETRTWWGAQFASLVEAGVRGWWNDMNEPSVFDVPTKTIDLAAVHYDNGLKTSHARNHNVYGMQMTRATYDGVKALRPQERPFLLTRASYAGGHRYSAAWTGDNVASWEHLRLSVAMCLSLSISGQPFVGSDVGGFIGSPSGELFARWLQLGVFTPLIRAHSVINAPNKEPWEYGDLFTTINRETINLRYQMLPYIYSTMEQASTSGTAPMRPLIFDYPDDDRFIWTEDEFLFGDQLLVAPVLEQGDTTRHVELPKGTWYDYWTGQQLEGGKEISVAAPLSRLPIFTKAGSIIPTQQAVQFSDQAPIDPLTLVVFPGNATDQTSWTYYEDEGQSFEYAGGRYLRRTMSQQATADSIVITLSACEGTYIPTKRSLVLKILGLSKRPRALHEDGQTTAGPEQTRKSPGEQGWRYDVRTGTLVLETQDMRSEQRFVIHR